MLCNRNVNATLHILDCTIIVRKRAGTWNFITIFFYMLREARFTAFHAEPVTDHVNAGIDPSVLTIWKRRNVFIHVYRKTPVKEKNNDEEDPFLLKNTSYI